MEGAVVINSEKYFPLYCCNTDTINKSNLYPYFFADAAYSLTFKTGDMPYAGTDANVTLQLFGDKGQTEKIMLRQESGKTLKRFDRGRTDRFTVQTMDVGKVSESVNMYIPFVRVNGDPIKKRFIE